VRLPNFALVLMRPAARVYLAIYDLCLQFGPGRGAVLLGYGPVILGVCAFLLKPVLLDPWLDSGATTIALFVLFGLCGPVINIGTRIVAENLHRRRHGRWPDTGAFPIDPLGPVSPTMAWVEAARAWAKEAPGTP
jgi:hypothetical protein